MKYTFTLNPSEGALNTVAYKVCREAKRVYLQRLNSINSSEAIEFGVTCEDNNEINIVILEFTTTNANLKTGVLDGSGFKLDEEVATVPIIHPDAEGEKKVYKYSKNPKRNFCIINALSGEQVNTDDGKCELESSVPYVALEVVL